MAEDFRTIQTDVLVVGAGGAGCRAAIEAGRNNVNVILVEKGFIGKSGTTAQAGARALRPFQNRRGVEERFKFMVQAGCYLNDQDILWTAISEGREDAKELVKFAEEINAGPMQNWNNALRHEISKYPNINVSENMIVTKLLISGGRITGATALDLRNGNFILFKVKAVILTTGGYGDLYRPSECAPLGINGGVWGDGQALAYHAGAELVEMEMVNQQALPANPRWNFCYRHFSPWSAYIPHGPFCDKDGKIISSLSTEAIEAMPIGCGPPVHGHTYRPLLERTIYRETLKGNTVYVDVVAKAKEQKETQNYGFGRKDPTIPDKALKQDPMKLPLVEIIIGPLLGQGGPKINVKCETSVPGLYAAGECPGNLYGSYRGNPFMDSILVHGKIAGRFAAEYAKVAYHGEAGLVEVAEEKNRIYGLLEAKSDPITPLEVKKKIWGITGKYLYMIRNAKGLIQAIREIEELRTYDLPRIQAVDIKVLNLDWVDAIETQSALDVVEMIARSALFREESRGCHYRDDFPEMDNKNWICHTLLQKDFDTGEMDLSKAPVVMTRLKPPAHPGEEPIPV